MKQWTHPPIMDQLPKRSYRVAVRIAQKNAACHHRNLGEQRSVEMTELMCGKNTQIKIAENPLSNGTIHHRIKNMSED
jgi:hypothetical protein